MSSISFTKTPSFSAWYCFRIINFLRTSTVSVYLKNIYTRFFRRKKLDLLKKGGGGYWLPYSLKKENYHCWTCGTKYGISRFNTWDYSKRIKTFSIKIPVFQICIGFHADPDPAFYLNADPDPETGSKTNEDPGQTLPSQKVGFWHEKFTLCRQ